MYCCVDCGSSTGSTTPTFASITTKYGQDKEATNLIIVLALIWCLVDTHYLDEPFFRWIHRNGVAWLGESRPSPFVCLASLPAPTLRKSTASSIVLQRRNKREIQSSIQMTSGGCRCGARSGRTQVSTRTTDPRRRVSLYIYIHCTIELDAFDKHCCFRRGFLPIRTTFLLPV